MKSTIKTVICLLVFLLSGCATFMEGSIESIPDPTYSFDRSTPVIVTIPSDLSNTKMGLESKSYLLRVVHSLRNSGFQKVSMDGDYYNAKEPFKIAVYVKVDKNTTSYTYRSPEYEDVQTGTKTTCKTRVHNNVSTEECTTTPVMSQQIVGYSNKIAYTTTHTFSLIASDIRSKQDVLTVTASSVDSGCSDIKLYDFLAEQALSRMSFKQIVKQNFIVKMPEGYRCIK